MADSEVQICNAALSRIGQSLLLDAAAPDIADAAAAAGTPVAEQCALWYPRARDATLRRYAWPFATLRTTLAVVAGETRSDWSFVYAYPSDALAVRFVTRPGIRNPRPSDRAPTRIEARKDPVAGDIVGKLILCDVEEAEISYTVQVENVAAFDSDFEDALVWRLASDLARALIKGKEGAGLADEYAQWFEWACRVAGAAAQNEETDELEQPSEFERARN